MARGLWRTAAARGGVPRSRGGSPLDALPPRDRRRRQRVQRAHAPRPRARRGVVRRGCAEPACEPRRGRSDGLEQWSLARMARAEVERDPRGTTGARSRRGRDTPAANPRRRCRRPHVRGRRARAPLGACARRSRHRARDPAHLPGPRPAPRRVRSSSSRARPTARARSTPITRRACGTSRRSVASDSISSPRPKRLPRGRPRSRSCATDPRIER